LPDTKVLSRSKRKSSRLSKKRRKRTPKNLKDTKTSALRSNPRLLLLHQLLMMLQLLSRTKENTKFKSLI